MRMIIAGSRGAVGEANYTRLRDYIRRNLPKPMEVVSGKNPKGGDAQGERFAAEHGIPVVGFKPDWDGLGKSAGYRRNKDMAEYAAEAPGSLLVALWDGKSVGTQHMINLARERGLGVHIVDAEGCGPMTPPDLIQVKDVTPPPPRIFAQSHSSLNVFETCPRQYEAKYITREVVFVQGPEAKWGDEVHQALENYLNAKGGMQLPANMLQYQPYADWVLNRAAKNGGHVVAERQSAVNSVKQATAYKAKDAWVRGKIDVTILYPDQGKAEVFDWKTGKIKNDVTQLAMYGALTLADYRDVGVVSAGFVWLKDGQISPPVFFQRADYYETWATFDHKYERLKDAYVRGVFPPKPGGLCAKWCDVKSCEFHGKGRR